MYLSYSNPSLFIFPFLFPLTSLFLPPSLSFPPLFLPPSPLPPPPLPFFPLPLSFRSSLSYSSLPLFPLSSILPAIEAFSLNPTLHDTSYSSILLSLSILSSLFIAEGRGGGFRLRWTKADGAGVTSIWTSTHKIRSH